MNQSIQVLDGYVYVVDKKALKLEVISAGQILPCFIYGQDKQALITLYQLHQFDIEEIIESMVKKNEMNVDGEIWFTAASVMPS